jgi:cytochrome P450
VPTPTNYRFRSAVATLHDEIEAVVAETDPADEPRSLLSVLNAADLDREQVRDELIALLFAGYDSTATALAMTLALVADHPDVQGRLRAELAETVGQRPPTAADLENLPVLDRVVRESLRLYPPQYVLLREPRADTALGEYRIAEGTTVVCSPWVHHRDARFWAAPAEFRPQRWRSDDDRPEFAYLPYGGGPRYCLGRGLAAQTIRLVVAVVCGRRRLELDGEIVVDAGPTLSPGPLELQTERDPL